MPDPFSPAYRSRDSILDITPMIDVVFLLLLFYMLTSSFSTDSAVSLDLPSGGTRMDVQPERMLISMDRHGNLFVDGLPCLQRELRKQLKTRLEKNSDLYVRLEMDRKLPVEQLVRVVDRLKEAGVRNLDIGTEGGTKEVEE